MKQGYKPDLGLHLKNLFPDNSAITFMSIEFTEIRRMAPELYSIFTHYFYDGTEYAMSLDFSINQLDELFALMQTHLKEDEFQKVILALLSFTEIKTTAIWSMPIPGICCVAKFGSLEVNQNEMYIPFIVEKFY